MVEGVWCWADGSSFVNYGYRLFGLVLRFKAWVHGVVRDLVGMKLLGTWGSMQLLVHSNS